MGPSQAASRQEAVWGGNGAVGEPTEQWPGGGRGDGTSPFSSHEVGFAHELQRGSVMAPAQAER